MTGDEMDRLESVAAERDRLRATCAQLRAEMERLGDELAEARGERADPISESERWVLDHWPRYHDGSCVRLGELVGRDGGARMRGPLASVEIDGDSATLWGGGDCFVLGHGARVTACDPEPEDSWSAIEVDARRPESEYCEERGIGRGQNAPAQRALMCADLVARCRALAGGEDR